MSTPHKAAALLLAAARVDPTLRVAAEEVQDALIALDTELHEQRDRVLALHRPETHVRSGALGPDPKLGTYEVCEHCTSGGDPYTVVSSDWPCPTVQALGGGS